MADVAVGHGLKPWLLDIGGGFVTETAFVHLKGYDMSKFTQFEKVAAAIEDAVTMVKYKFVGEFQVIAEPGRYFAADCIDLVTRIYGKRIMFTKDDVDISEESSHTGTETELLEAELVLHVEIDEIKYYVGEGYYGWFNNIVYDKI